MGKSTISMENPLFHAINGKIHYKLPFSIIFCMFTRGDAATYGNIGDGCWIYHLQTSLGDRKTSAKDPPSTIEFCRYGPTMSGKCHEITLIKYPLVI